MNGMKSTAARVSGSARKISGAHGKTFLIGILMAAMVSFSVLILFPATAQAATFTVTNTNNSGAGSLRQAILDANSSAGADTIAFAIPGAGVHTIKPTSFLPAFTDQVTVDGYTQPGSARATGGTPATILIEIDGSDAGANVGGLYFWYNTSGSRVSGLAIGNWNRDGIYILGDGGIQIDGNYIGTDASGSVSRGNQDCGIIIEQEGSSGTVVGGTDPGERNLISGNIGDGVSTVLANNCVIQGNYIGTDASGTTAIANTGNGVSIYGDGSTVGGTAAGAGNVISGNTGDGVEVQPLFSSDTVAGNYIGTNAAGTAALPNGGHGVDISGGPTTIEQNVISANSQQGINLGHSTDAVVKGNFLGTDASGASALPNQWSGICVNDNSSTVTIGGTTVGERNVISGNQIYGADIQDSKNVTVTGNYFGTNAGGDASLQNGYAGVKIWKGSENIDVGGQTAAERNVISGNYWSGVDISDCKQVNVTGNFIGTDASGTSALGNNWGISIASGSDDTVIGGAAAGRGNVISGNKCGIYLNGCSDIQVQGNCIGTDAAGTAALGNTSEGVYLSQGASDNQIGGGAGNIISGNDDYGVYVYKSTGNQVLGNFIGTTDGATSPLGNGGVGVYIDSGSDNTIVGGSGDAGNYISCNGKDGVGIRSSTGCMVSGNQIMDNTGIGVVVWDKASYRNEISQNSIYGNGALGIDLGGDGVTPNDGNNNNPNKPNRGYNFPVITGGRFLTPGTAVVSGTAPPNSMVELYWVGASPDPSGHGQGAQYLATANADAAGSFTATFSGTPADAVISAIAISPSGDPSGQGNTSEFSANATLTVPSIAGCDPTSAVQGHTLNIDITGSGTHFQDGTSAATFSGTGITVNSTHVTDANHAMANITVAPDAPVGPRDVNVVTGSETPEALVGGFEVKAAPPAPPRLDSLDPTSGTVGTPVTLAGQYFGDAQGSSYVFFNGTKATAYDSWADGKVVCRVPSVATTGPVTVTTPAGTSNGIDFTVEPPQSPIIKDCSPTKVVQGHSLNLDILGEGTHFQQGQSAAEISGGGVSVGSTSVSDPTHATAAITVASDATPGARDVNVITGDETPTPLTGVFTIYAAPPTPPELDRLHPDEGPAGTVVSAVGKNFGQVQGSSRVTIGGVPATHYISWSDYEVVVSVPFGAASGPVVVETPWGASNGLDFTVSAPSFYFAEGTCRSGFTPYLTVQNPGSADADVSITYMRGDGTTLQQTLPVPATSRVTVAVKAVLGEGDDVAHDFSCQVVSSGGQDIIAERPMYFDYNGVWTGGSDVVGAVSTAPAFYFAEGTCRPGFTPYLTVQNPGSADTEVSITYMKGDCTTQTQTLTVPATSRVTVAVKAVLGEGDDAAHDFSCKVESTGGQNIVAERPMYFDYNGVWTGGSDVVGALSPAEAFYFAEGTCRSGFEPYLTILNPGLSNTQVKISYMRGDGGTTEQFIEVPAQSRSTVFVPDILGNGNDVAHDFSCKVESTGGQGIVVERPMYFNYNGVWTGGSDVVGFAP